MGTVASSVKKAFVGKRVQPVSVSIVKVDGNTIELDDLNSADNLRTVKSRIHALEGTDTWRMELCSAETTSPLADTVQLIPLLSTEPRFEFMLFVKTVPVITRWASCNESLAKQTDGGTRVSTTTSIPAWKPLCVTEFVTEGCAFMELQLSADNNVNTCMMGVVRLEDGATVDFNKHYTATGCKQGATLNSFTGGLNGGPPLYNDAFRQGKLSPGDKVGMFLDVEAGSLAFFLNGKQCGPGYLKGVIKAPVAFYVEGWVAQADHKRVKNGAVTPQTISIVQHAQLPEWVTEQVD